MNYYIIGILLLGFILYTIFIRNPESSLELFSDPDQEMNSLTQNTNQTPNQNIMTTIDNTSVARPIKIVEYETYDSGVKVIWEKPNDSVDYMAVIKDEADGEEVKMFFKDTIAVDCGDDYCSYHFENLINDHTYSFAITTLTSGGISDFSNKIKFTPTTRNMKCNADGTCTYVKSSDPNSIDYKLSQISGNEAQLTQLIDKCQNMLKKNNAIYDINKIYNADGSFKDVKDKLEYPEHLLVPIRKGPNSLGELVKHQLELGIININIHNQKDAQLVQAEQKLSDAGITL